MIFYSQSESFNPSKATQAATTRVFASLREAQMARFIVLVLSLLFPLVFAQGTIQGTISASEASGFTVIACYANAEVGCNESLSRIQIHSRVTGEE
jgi:hypothetical protein